jgi:hypothetical protein
MLVARDLLKYSRPRPDADERFQRDAEAAVVAPTLSPSTTVAPAAANIFLMRVPPNDSCGHSTEYP